MPALLERRVNIPLHLSHSGPSTDGAAKPNILKEKEYSFIVWILLLVLSNGILFSFIYMTQKLSRGPLPPGESSLEELNPPLLNPEPVEASSSLRIPWTPVSPVLPLPVGSVLYLAMKQPPPFWVPLKRKQEWKSLDWWFWSRGEVMRQPGKEVVVESSPRPLQ